MARVFLSTAYNELQKAQLIYPLQQHAHTWEEINPLDADLIIKPTLDNVIPDGFTGTVVSVDFNNSSVDLKQIGGSDIPVIKELLTDSLLATCQRIDNFIDEGGNDV